VERIRQILDPDYLARLDGRALDDLRAMRSRCAEFELTVSYDRRMVQARMEILEAERERRARGGSLDELVADLPRILGAEPGRAGVSSTRLANAQQTPSIQLHWPDGRETLIADSTLADLPDVSDDELASTTERLHDFERELSEVRHELHGVIDRLDQEIASRQVAGTP
jgi:RsiG-like